MSNPLKIVIVGAGLGGLACAVACRLQGLDVLVLERAQEILPVGAGIQIPPNAARVMQRLELLESLKKKGCVLDGIINRRYEDGKKLCFTPGGKSALDNFGAPWLVIHREDYHRVLLDEAVRLGAQIKLNSDVQEVNFDRSEVILGNGESISGDVIVGADGLWSTIRPLILSKPSPPIETGDLAYRGTFTLEQLHSLKDQRVEELCSQNVVNVWMGPQKHCVFYPVRGGLQFNLVLLRPDNLPQGSRTAQGDLGEMRDTFKGWDEVLTRIISCISSVLKWKLCHHDELELWTKNNFALLGDACHPTLPYQAQGAAMAVEDGAVLGQLLGLLTATASDPRLYVPYLLQLYESLRKTRTTLNVKGAVGNREMFHMPDGPEQEARDRMLAEAGPLGSSNCEWIFKNREYQKELLGWDAVEDCRCKFEEWWRERQTQRGPQQGHTML